MTGLRRLLRPSGSCPAGSELSRAASEGPEPRLQAHLGRCADCAAEYDSLRRISLRAGGAPEAAGEPRGLRPHRDGAPRRPEGVAAAAVDGTCGAPVPALARWTLTVAFGGISIIGGFWLARHRSGLPASSLPPTAHASTFTRATIRAFGDARFGRVQPPPDEAVRLDEGTLRARCARARTDGDLSGADDGRRDSRPRRRSSRRPRSAAASSTSASGAGGSRSTPVASRRPCWRRATRGAASGRGQVTPTRWRARRRRPGSRHGGPPPSPPERSRSWTRIPRPRPTCRRRSRSGSTGPGRCCAQGRAAEAATAFSEAALRARGTSLEEDAVYWRAVALARAGDGPGAGRELTAFLERFPQSSHGGEARVALGWMLLEGGQPT